MTTHARNPRSSRGTLAAIVCCLGLLMAFVITGRLAWAGKGPTFDEPIHYVAAFIQTHYSDFRDDPENSPLWKYYITAGTSADALKIDRTSRAWEAMLLYPGQWIASSKTILYGQAHPVADALIDAARSRMVLLGAALGALIGWWAWRLAGPMAAVVAVAFFSLDPNFLAHAPLVKNDAPIALALLGLMAGVWLLGERVTVLRIVSTGLLLGVAATTKFSGVLGVPMIGGALVIRALLPQAWPMWRWNLRTRGGRLAAAMLISVGCGIIAFAVIWGAYGFRYAPTSEPGKYFDFAMDVKYCCIRETLESQGWQGPSPVDLSGWHPSLPARGVEWMNLHAIFPQAWSEGFLFMHSTTLGRPSLLCGEFRQSGWWYYFPLAMAFKTPLATIGAIILSAVMLPWWAGSAVRDHKKGMGMLLLTGMAVVGIPLILRPVFQTGFREILPVYSCVIVGLLAAALAGVAFWAKSARVGDCWPVVAAVACPMVYLAMAMQSHINIGIRHILPIYPFLFIFVGVAAAKIFAMRPRAAGVAIAIFLLGLGAETYAAFPDFIPFFNVAVGGEREGMQLLDSTNMDWGQELPALAQWQQANPDRQMYLCYLGFPEPKYYGIRYVNLPGSHTENDLAIPAMDANPVVAISAEMLQVAGIDPSIPAMYEPFRYARPIGVLGGAIYLFDAPPQWRQMLEQNQ